MPYERNSSIARYDETASITDNVIIRDCMHSRTQEKLENQ